MSNDLWIDPSISILSLKRRWDRRNVAISSIMWSEFINLGNVRFIDAMDAADYTDPQTLIKDIVSDGFDAFGVFHDVTVDSDFFAPLTYAWSLCRYFRELSKKEKDNNEFFMQDDMHGIAHSHFIVTSKLLRELYNAPIITNACTHRKISFKCLLFSTRSEGLPSVQRSVFEEVVDGTTRLNLKSGFFSREGADLILKRLLHQISLGKPTPKAFLDALEDVSDWDIPEGIFSMTEPLFVEYPIEFLGSDVRGIPRLQGHLGKLFSEVKPS
jgi:hypothetical protein